MVLCIKLGKEKAENAFIAAPTGAAPPRQRREFASIAFVTRMRLPGEPNPHMPPPGGI